MKNSFQLITAIIILLSNQALGQKAPDFTLKNLERKNFTLYDRLENGPVLIDFWATWCKPCLEAMPHITEINKRYKEQGLQVAGISIDNPRSQAKVKPMVRAKGFNFEILIDGDQEVRKLFGGTVVPLTLLINTEGEIVYRHIGYVPGDEKILEEKIVALMSESESKP